VDFTPPLAAESQSYTLEYGPKVKRAAAGRLRFEEDPDRVTVTTDWLQFSVRRRGFNLIDSLYADTNGNGTFEPDEQALAAGPDAGAYLVDHEGNRYDTSLDMEPQVQVEERGPPGSRSWRPAGT